MMILNVYSGVLRKLVSTFFLNTAGGSLLFKAFFGSLLIVFLFIRFDYLYFPWQFDFMLIWLIGLMYIGVVLFRVFNNWKGLLLDFLPEGTPLEISPLICILEVISFLVRPFVLVFRPFINLSFGAVVMSMLIVKSFGYPCWCIYLWLSLWFCYEIFVYLVQSYIVYLILLFTKDI